MSKGKSLGLSAVFLAIAVLVSGSLVMTLRGNYVMNGQSPTVSAVIQMLQKT